MDNLNVYQKTRIILLVLIIIASVVFVISALKSKDRQNYIAQETLSNLESRQSDSQENITTQPIEMESIPGDVIETEDTSWDDPDAKETKVEEEEAEKSKNKYYLKINYTANVVTAYTKDNDGKYTVPAKVMVCSTGAATPTSGVYKMSNKYRWHQLNGGVYGQYCSRITGHILFHSVPYATNSPDSLKYVAYDKLGTKASAGCIRLTVADAMWVYNNCASGTCVEFYSSSNPGPLGKPTAQKIASNEACRNWDPTDPTAGNPWHTYKEPEPAPVEAPKSKTENNKNTESTSKQEEIIAPEEPKPENTSTETNNTENKEPNPNENTTPQNTDNTGTNEQEDKNEPKEEPKPDTGKEDTEKTNEDQNETKGDNNSNSTDTTLE